MTGMERSLSPFHRFEVRESYGVLEVHLCCGGLGVIASPCDSISHKWCFSFHCTDGKRCGETLRSIFETAKDPDKVVVGVIEQNDPEDEFCLSVYCGFYGEPSEKFR